MALLLYLILYIYIRIILFLLINKRKMILKSNIYKKGNNIINIYF